MREKLQMERHYLEEEPNSAPEFVASAAPSSSSYFPPGHNDKYVVNKEGQTTQWDVAPPLPPTAGREKKKRRVWIFVALGIFAIIVVAAVVGGVVGSRDAHKNSSSIQSDSALSSSPTPSANNTTTPSTTISNNNPTSTTTTSPSATPSTDNNPSSANNGTTHLAIFDMYETDTCGGLDDSFAITSAGSQRCVPVPSNKRSIQVIDNSSCIVTTWSGGDCRGSSFRVPDTACHSVLYAAVSVYC